jgi:hypothetical protein
MRCKRLGIEKTEQCKSKQGKLARAAVDDDSLCKLDQTVTLDDLTNVEYQLLVGSLLGDGCIKRNGNFKKRYTRHYVFYEGHHAKQFDYVKWKSELLKVFEPRFYPNVEKPELITPQHPIFTKLKSSFYQCGKRKNVIPTDFLDRFDEIGLLIWYLDDGGLANRTMSICVKLFPREETVKATEKINQVLGLGLIISKEYKHRDKTYRKIVIPASSRDKLMPLWDKFVYDYNLPNCMKYKLKMPKKYKRSV